MKTASTLLALLIGLLSIAAGGAKIALVPEEVAFLSQFGFTTALTMSYGAVQILGGLLLIIPKTRFYGAIITAIAFAMSAVLLLVAGNIAFAGVSVVPVILAGFIANRGFTEKQCAPQG